MKSFKKGIIFMLAAALCVAAGLTYYNFVKKQIPDKLYIYTQDNAVFSMDVPVVGTVYDSANAACASNVDFSDSVTVRSGETGSYHVDYKLFGVLPIARTDVEVVEQKYVYTGGFQVGIYLKCDGVYVAGIETICTDDGKNVVPTQGKIQKGDYIVQIDGSDIDSKEQLVTAVAQSDGNSLLLSVNRDGEIIQTEITPVKNAAGDYKIGLWVKDDTQGVGTVTYVGLDGSFAALGHGISDNETGKVLKISAGRIYRTKIISVVPGRNGDPGELLGTIDYKSYNILGEITSNSSNGVYGEDAYSLCSDYPLELMQAGASYDVTEGAASIHFFNNGEFRDYEIEIMDLSYGDSKNMTFKVTSTELLKLTNGIVQGMSGSPIIQNGKIVGAVTHVFVDDSTCGYGIFIDRMLRQQ